MILFAWGSTLVVSSMWKLGVTGTYLGDYFGILMNVRDLCPSTRYERNWTLTDFEL